MTAAARPYRSITTASLPGKLHDFREQTYESMTPGPPGPVLAGALSCWRRFRSGPYTPFLPSHPGWCRAV